MEKQIHPEYNVHLKIFFEPPTNEEFDDDAFYDDLMTSSHQLKGDFEEMMDNMGAYVVFSYDTFSEGQEELYTVHELIQSLLEKHEAYKEIP